MFLLDTSDIYKYCFITLKVFWRKTSRSSCFFCLINSFNSLNVSLNVWHNWLVTIKMLQLNPHDIYLLRVSNRNTRTRCEICSKLTMKTRHWRRSGIFIGDFEHISHLVLVFLLLIAGWEDKDATISRLPLSRSLIILFKTHFLSILDPLSKCLFKWNIDAVNYVQGTIAVSRFRTFSEIF